MVKKENSGANESSNQFCQFIELKRMLKCLKCRDEKKELTDVRGRDPFQKHSTGNADSRSVS